MKLNSRRVEHTQLPCRQGLHEVQDEQVEAAKFQSVLCIPLQTTL
jgi:hypothetical protein